MENNLWRGGSIIKNVIDYSISCYMNSCSWYSHYEIHILEGLQPQQIKQSENPPCISKSNFMALVPPASSEIHQFLQDKLNESPPQTISVAQLPVLHPRVRRWDLEATSYRGLNPTVPRSSSKGGDQPLLCLNPEVLQAHPSLLRRLWERIELQEKYPRQDQTSTYQQGEDRPN